MKKLSILLALVLCMMLAFGAQAAEYAPGDTVTVPVSVSADNAYFIGLTVKYDSSIFEYVSISCTGPNAQANGTTMMMYTITDPIPNGQVGSITLKIKEGVKSGTYAVTVAVTGAYDIDENDVSCRASGGSVTVAGAACTHSKADFKVVKEADCVNAGERQIVCTDCGEVLSTETIEKLGHDFGNYALTKAATCTEAGEETAKCSRCDEKETREVKALGHSFGVYAETKKATCTEKGEETAKCVRCDVTDAKETAALGHSFGEWTVTKAATCTEKGEEASTCSACGAAETKEIAALGHEFAAYTVTKAATCTEKGEETAKCSRCDAVETKEIAALGHDFGAYTVTKAATCTEKGEMTYTCTVCDKVVKTEEIAALGHKPGKWIIVKEATKEEDGFKERYCTVCDVLVDSQVIPHAQWYSMTVSSVGIRFRDVSDITDKWDMFTPVDLSADGEQTFDLVAGNKHIIGEVTVKVAEGQVTVTYKPLNQVDMKNDFLTFFADLASVTTLDESQLTGYAFGEPVSIADQLGGDTKVLVYIHGNAVYRDDVRGLEELAHKTKAYQQYIEELKAIMD